MVAVASVPAVGPEHMLGRKAVSVRTEAFHTGQFLWSHNRCGGSPRPTCSPSAVVSLLKRQLLRFWGGLALSVMSVLNGSVSRSRFVSGSDG